MSPRPDHMVKRRLPVAHPFVTAITAALVAASFMAAAAEPEVADGQANGTSWAKKRIATFEASGGKELAQVIQKYSYRGRPAYLFTSPCCDRFNYLYDVEGRVLCAPSGGFTGRGDGRCLEPLGPPLRPASPPKTGPG